ncbi:MAG: PQQ-binding-like beta-propeller repeat protein [Spirochaetaceae bacterium]|jgi:outer membrane protein assembly factor BamB|nr:PQQ-binding-like beta-propeller repeat protein [Spirochaetaceae bacterium]
MSKTLTIFILCVFPVMIFAESIDEPELLWRQVLGGAALTKPSAQLGSVVIVCEGGLVKAFGADGTFLWEYKAGGRLQPFIARSASGSSYVCRTNGVFSAINRSGRRLWQLNLKEGLAAPPLTGWDERIFIFLNKKLLCFTASGKRLWQIELESPLALAPAPDNSGGFVSVLENNKFIRVSAFGKMNILQLAAAPLALLPVSSEAAAKPPIAALYSGGGLELIESSPPRLLTRFPSPPVAAVERGGRVAALLANGELTLFAPESGVLWSAKTDIASGLASEDDRNIEIKWNERGIYLLSRNGGEGYNLRGERLWNMLLRGSATIPVLDEGVLYSSGKDWIFYAYRVEEYEKPAAAQDAAAHNAYNLKADGNYGLGRALSETETQKLLIFAADTLDTVEERIRRGDLGTMEPEYTRILLGISGVSGGDVNLRLKALRLLGLSGSCETVPFLAGLFRKEQNIHIKSAAAQAIGAIGLDTDGSAMAAFAAFIASPHTYFHERLLSSLAASIGKLCRFSGPPASELGIPLLINLAGPASPKTVRRGAEQELYTLFYKK